MSTIRHNSTHNHIVYFFSLFLDLPVSSVILRKLSDLLTFIFWIPCVCGVGAWCKYAVRLNIFTDEDHYEDGGNMLRTYCVFT
jgi:hypothetical protein